MPDPRELHIAKSFGATASSSIKYSTITESVVVQFVFKLDACITYVPDAETTIEGPVAPSIKVVPLYHWKS